MKRDLDRFDNPWETPGSDLLDVPMFAEVWRDGDEVVIQRPAELPPRCVRCNESVTGPIARKRIAWHAQGWYLLLLLNIVLWAVVALFVRRAAVIRPALCPAHRRRRWRVMVAGTIATVGATLSSLLWLSHDGLWLGAGFIAAFIILVITFEASRTVYPSRIDAKVIRLRGAGPAFLDSLPRRFR